MVNSIAMPLGIDSCSPSKGEEGGKMDGIAISWSRGSRGPQHYCSEGSNKHLHRLSLTFQHGR